MSKKIIIIAGPNGAGKTTFARSFLPVEAQCERFINADLIAAGLSPFVPDAAAIKAGRLMLEEVADSVQQGMFIFWRYLMLKPLFLAWRKGCVRAVTIFQRPSFVAASRLDGTTSVGITDPRLMPGLCMTTLAPNPYYRHGERTDEKTRHFYRERP